MFQDITLQELRHLQQEKELVLVDVRSPSEFSESTIPGSLNVPFFDDDERAEIGTLYKQKSVQAAKDRGLEIISAKLPAFIREFGQIPGKKAVFCWRGGMRSRTTATLLALMDIHAYRLVGGYRAYRKWVLESLESFDLKSKSYVINGNTGTGKTALLQKLQENGYPVLDLEAMAGHRGSIFGEIGLKANNQKTFDALLLERLILLQNKQYVLYEAESKRIGKVVLPDFFIHKKENGKQIWIEMPIEARVRQILEDYRPWEHQEECLQAFKQIKSRIHTPVAAEIETCLKAGRFEVAVQLLLEHYYDPRYAYSINQYDADQRITFRARTQDEAISAVQDYLQENEQSKL